MPQLRIFGAVGKASTRMMVEAILASTGAALTAPVVVALSPDADESGRPWAETVGEPAADTIVVLNADSGLSQAGAARASVTTFGLGDCADVQAVDLEATAEGTAFTLIAGGEEHHVQLLLLGEHQVINALAAIAASIACGIPSADAITALEALTTLGSGRMYARPAAGDRIIIDDTISATGQSTAAALKALTQVAGGRRSVAVLGELSLGASDAADDDPDSALAAAHDRIGRLIVRLNVKKLVVVGHAARHIHNAAGLEGSWDGESVLVDTPQQAYDFLRDELREQDVVLVKSAAGGGLAHLADRLAEVDR